MSIRVRNWRDQAPYVGHISALVWTLYQSRDKDETSPPEINRLNGINSFVKHGLQGHQHSDHHQHDSIEQLYFVLRGRGQLIIGDDKVDVRDGTAVYMPVNVPHQAFNDGEGWMEHLIVSCPLDEIREGTAAVRDWRDVHPVVLDGGTVSWPLLRREEDAPASEGGVLQRVHSVTRYAVQGRQSTAVQQLDGIELVHYVLSGYGTIEEPDEDPQLVTEGSAAHVLPGVEHKLVNQSEGWLEYVTFAVEVGEIEIPAEDDEDAETQEPDSAEEAAAAVLAAVDWDDADTVETEEEIEEAVAADAIDDEESDADGEPDEEGDGVDDEEAAGEADVDDAEAEEEEDDGEDDLYDEEADGEDDGEDGDAEEDEEAAGEAEVDDAVAAEEEDGEDDLEVDEGEHEGEDGSEDDEEEGEGEIPEDEEEDEVEEEDEDVAEEVADDAEDSDVDEEEDVEGEEDEVGEEEEEPAADTEEEDLSSEDEDDPEDEDFDLEEEDETAVEDETGEEDYDSPDPDRR